jgi:HK97 family phage portal protein
VRLFGLEIRRADAVEERSYSSVPSSGGGWYPLVHEPYTGAWQRNDSWQLESVLSHPTVYRCVNLIASDIAKMRTKLVELMDREKDLWVEVESGAFSPVLRQPNRYQTPAQFKKNWIISRLIHGNTYILLERDNRDVVIRMYVLDPNSVRPVVTEDGDVLYQLSQDNLTGVSADVAITAIPASEIMHDRISPLFHPLVGIPPLFAAGGPAHVGLTVQRNSAAYFDNDSSPPGILSGPNIVTAEQAKEMVERWHARKKGQIAALGNGLKYEPLRGTVVESQTIEHLKWTGEAVAAAFGVPAFMVGAGPVPALNNTEALTRQYYTTCLHDHAHDMETVMDRGLGLDTEKTEGRWLGVQLDVMALMQMDTATQMETLTKGVRGGVLTPNEARAERGIGPLTGGDTIYLQHQDYPIEALYDRDLPDPNPQPPTTAPAAEPEPDEDDDEDERRAALALTVEFALTELIMAGQ